MFGLSMSVIEPDYDLRVFQEAGQPVLEVFLAQVGLPVRRFRHYFAHPHNASHSLSVFDLLRSLSQNQYQVDPDLQTFSLAVEVDDGLKISKQNYTLDLMTKMSVQMDDQDFSDFANFSSEWVHRKNQEMQRMFNNRSPVQYTVVYRNWMFTIDMQEVEVAQQEPNDLDLEPTAMVDEQSEMAHDLIVLLPDEMDLVEINEESTKCSLSGRVLAANEQEQWVLNVVNYIEQNGDEQMGYNDESTDECE